MVSVMLGSVGSRAERRRTLNDMGMFTADDGIELWFHSDRPPARRPIRCAGGQECEAPGTRRGNAQRCSDFLSLQRCHHSGKASVTASRTSLVTCSWASRSSVAASARLWLRAT